MIFTSGYWKKIEVLDGSLINWVGGDVVGEDWFGRDVLTRRLRQHALLNDQPVTNILKKPNTTTVKKRAGR